MTVSALIKFATDHPLRAEQINGATESLRVSVEALYDLFATAVAQRYLRGELPYVSGDAAMNELFGYATSGGGPELTRLAWQVYEAFDEGEYLHAGEPVDQQGEVRTRILLARIAELRDA